MDCCFTTLTQPRFRLPSHLTQFQSPSGKTNWPGTSAQDCESPLVSKALGRKQVFNRLKDYIIMKVLFKFVCFTSVAFILPPFRLSLISWRVLACALLKHGRQTGKKSFKLAPGYILKR